MDCGLGAPIIYRCRESPAHGFTIVVPGAYVAYGEIAGLVREGLEGRIARAVG
ncbi:MAG: hypothetical protein Q7T84_09045 [Phenylobacterium sp.]|uniref:hypothetical protein n=1 Tax=Phenylobacterium sp. TaxID=1871053 RepID=UPI002721463A|nr:hypothetical protein [Phenylobacterium sp.]MDO9431435.1 hypothetical protein [Phenylobacterium sp.]